MSDNLLLAPPKYKITATAFGIRREFLYSTGARYSDFRSNLAILGFPLIAIANGRNPETGRMAVAKGVIAIGQRARGFIAIGQMATGVIAIGQLAVGGVIGIGQLAVTPLALGQATLALAALGQVGMAVYGIFMGGLVYRGYTMSDLMQNYAALQTMLGS